MVHRLYNLSVDMHVYRVKKVSGGKGRDSSSPALSEVGGDHL